MELPGIFGRNIINILVRELLCCRLFAMFSKITFGVYLYHIFFIFIWFASAIPAPMVGVPMIWQAYMAVLCQVTVLALGIHLVFEMPIATLSTYLVGLVQGKKKKISKKSPQDDVKQTNL